MPDNADSVNRDRDALRSYELEPRSTEPPAQTWCVLCRSSVVDPVVSMLCPACDPDFTTIALQSEDK